MKVGFNLLLWTTHVTAEHTPVLEALKGVGYDGVEVPIFEGTADEHRATGARLRDLGLEATGVTVMSPEASPISPDARVRQAAVDRLKWVLDQCASLGARLLCGPIHSPLGTFSGAAPTADERRWGAETLRQVADHAAGMQIDLAVEYLNRFENYFLTTAADTFQWIDDIDHPRCGMMWDTFHAHIEEKEVEPVIEGVRSRLIHVHISENDRGAPGSGQVNWAGTFAALQRIKYDRWLVIEAFGRFLPDLAAATRVWRDLFRDPADVYAAGFDFIRNNVRR